MNTQVIAKFILERRLRASPILMTGDVVSAISSDGLQEALQRRWIVPEYDGGNLQVTTDMGRLAEIEAIAALPVQEDKTADERASAGYAVEHANRPFIPISEIQAPGIGKPLPTTNTSTAPATQPPAPVTPTAPTPKRTLDVGDDVGVVESGKAYSGKVASRTPGGKFTLSFGQEKPAVVREYSPEELRYMPNAV